MRKYLVAGATVLILIAVNWSIVAKEIHLREGEVVYLELAPVDPRSLMQGDYMALRFAIGNRIQNALSRQGAEGKAPYTGDGYVIVERGPDNIGHFQRLAARDEEALAGSEMRLYYRIRDGQVRFATNAFFFQEGHADRYESARYGQFRVNEKGEPLLVAMYDKDLNALGEPRY